jgi:uncharacterized protein YndB with AHSA1/START domain
MTENPSTTHSTLVLERTYPAARRDVFGAWAVPAAKARWFAGPGAEHRLDFQVGGEEQVAARVGEAQIAYTSLYRDIVDDERIVYTSVLTSDGRLATCSLTTVELDDVAGGTRLTLTEQCTFLDGLEQAAWREQGTAEQLDALGDALTASPAPPPAV